MSAFADVAKSVIVGARAQERTICVEIGARIRSTVKRISNPARTGGRDSIIALSLVAATAASIDSTITPLTRFRDHLGDRPLAQAMTGVPAEWLRSSTSPKGSGQSIGNKSARALPRNSHFCSRQFRKEFDKRMPRGGLDLSL